MAKLFVVGLGGFAGAVLRYWLSGWVYGLTQSDFPVGTLAVNLAGSLILGVAMGVVENHIVPPHLQLFVTIGLLGGFTTFSTFSFETYSLIEIGSIGKAVLNLLLSVGVGLTALMAGLMAGRAL
ncbi:MAG: fluoride efflux transporter CrcB [Acidobacteriota bacterium]